MVSELYLYFIIVKWVKSDDQEQKGWSKLTNKVDAEFSKLLHSENKTWDIADHVIILMITLPNHQRQAYVARQ